MKSIFYLLAVILLVGCQSKTNSNNKVVAKVFGEKITIAQLETETKIAINILTERQRPIGSDMFYFKKGILTKLINDKMIKYKLDSLGITQDIKFVESLIKEQEEYFGSKELFIQELAKHGITMDIFIKNSLHQTRLDKLNVWIEKHGPKVSDKDILDYYNKNLDKLFTKPQKGNDEAITSDIVDAKGYITSVLKSEKFYADLKREAKVKIYRIDYDKN